MAGSKFLEQFFPDERVPSVRDVDYEKLVNSGIKAVIFDLDNTIARWGEDSLGDDIIELFDRLTGLGLKIGILSNGRGERIEDFVSDLPYPNLFNASKPRRKGFKAILGDLGVPPEDAAMIGDQLFTDIFGANRMDMYTIRVEPIDLGKEYRFTRINRIGERILLSLRNIYRSCDQFRNRIGCQ